MRSTFSILFYINRNKVKTDSTTAVLCRISIDGKQTVLSTGIYCNPDNWNAKKGSTGNERDNNRLAEFQGRLEQAYENILKEQGVISAELLKNTIVGVNTVPTMLLQAGEEELKRLELRSLEIGSTSTYRQSKLTQRNLKAFVCFQGKEDIAFAAIREGFGESFKMFCKRELGFSPTHTNRHLCWLNRLIYIAVDQEILRANPLEDVAYEKKDPPKLRHITRSQLKQMMETPMPNGPQELARRMFIFSSFCGLAYVDMQRLYPRHIGKTAGGRLYIRKKREKTNVEAFIPLHPVAEQILRLYNTTDGGRPVFPLPENRDVHWFEISSVGIALGFKENLSHHMSRHNFGTLLLSAGISIESIAKMMGHANISTTQGYAKVTDDKISEDMDKLMERRKTNCITMKRAIVTISDNGVISVPNKVRMTTTEIADLFGLYYLMAKKTIRSIEKSGIISGDYSMCCIVEGQKVYPEYYGLEMIIAVAFRIQSPKAEIFRQWTIKKAAKPDIPATLGISFQNAMLN